MAQTVGAANLAAGLRDPYLACSPVIAVTGGPDAMSSHKWVYQEIYDFPLFEPLTKFNARVERVERLPDLLRQAFRAATTGTPGPTHLEIPGNQGQLLDGQADLELVFDERFKQVPAFRPEASPDDTAQVARLLTRAERPVIVAGGGVRSSGAQAEVVELAEMLSIPVATSLNAKATIPDNHPLAVGVVGNYSRDCANRVVGEADLVFFVGSHTGSQVTNIYALPRKGTSVVQLDINPIEVGRNFPNVASMVGDAKVSLRRMIESLEPTRPRQQWLDRVHEIVGEWRAEYEPLRNSDTIPLRPERLCKEISDVLPENGVVASDTGHSGIWTGTMIDLTHPGQDYIRCAGSLGWGLPGFMGIKCALPDRPVIGFTGDGGLYYHLSELETAARYNIPVVIVVNNNDSLNQETRIYNSAYKGNERGSAYNAWHFLPTNFARIADELGCLGIRVEKPEEIRPALEKALASGRPTVVDVHTDIAALAARPYA
jgi:acetolactate synthase-1/2/3 large subunit